MYQAQLPYLKERVLAALLLFAFAIAMVTMTTFAWNTLSVAPEVSGAKTTLTANGNLEIALAGAYTEIVDANGNIIGYQPKPPSEAAVGDSLLAITQRNQTWGNLINLSDPSYGLDEIILRPATLNKGSLAKKPFVSAKYGPDGRVEIDNNSNFKYTKYQILQGDIWGFGQSDIPGVKAVSSVKIDRLAITSKLGSDYTKVMDETVDQLLTNAYTRLQEIVTSLDLDWREDQSDAEIRNTNPLGSVLEVYLNGLLYGTLEENSTKPNGDRDAGPIYFKESQIQDIQYIYEVLLSLDSDVIVPIGEALAEIFDLYQLDTYVDKTQYDNTPYIPTEVRYYLDKDGNLDIDAFLSNAPTVLATLNSVRKEKSMNELPGDYITILSEYSEIRADLKECIDATSKQLEGGRIYWYEMKETINKLVDIETALINDKTPNDDTQQTLAWWFGRLNNTTVALQAKDMLDANHEANEILIRKGILKDLTALLYTDTEGILINKVETIVERSAVEAKLSGSSLSNLLGMIFGSGQTKTLRAHALTDAVVVEKNGVLVDNVIRKNITQSKGALKAEYVFYTYTAQDTYGLAIDFWLRTNVPESYLILEGEVKLKYEDVKANVAITNAETGESTTQSVNVYLATIKVVINEAGAEPVESITENVEIYTLDESAANKEWYYLESGKKLATEEAKDEEGNILLTTTYSLETTPVKKQNGIPIGYSGSNRVWDEDDLPLLEDQIKYSTSQGSGSCYTFYADPNELNSILNVLELMRVAFVDIHGNLLAIAKLDTKYCFSEYGRHIVPLVLCSGYDEVEANGKTYHAITSLTKNEATFMTALVYLEGTNIENKDVLSSSDIKGQFNLQFGTTFDEEALKNEDLMHQTMNITAGATNWDKDATEYKTTVTVDIQGITPSRVTANFMRQISSTQGSLQETMNFAKNAEGKWVADYTFTTPGTYILRSVTIDGIERILPSPITFEIEGFKIGALSSRNNLGAYHTVLTADHYYRENFTIDIAASGKFDDPDSVRGIFTSKDNVNVDVNFVKGTSTTWEGSAFFSTSGEYTLSYLLIDGEYYAINSFVRDISLGLTTRVWIDFIGNPEKDFDKENEKYQYDPAKGHTYVYYNKSHEFAVSVEIYDASGNEVKRLGGTSGLTVYYNGDDTDVYWDANADRYIGGKFKITNVGSYTFKSVLIPMDSGDNQIVTTATVAPSITVIANKPFEYLEEVEASTNEFIVFAADSVNTNPTLSLSFIHARAATVYGKFAVKNKKDEPIGPNTKWVILEARWTEGEEYEDNSNSGSPIYKDVYVFDIPKTDGYYELVEVKMTNVYYKDDLTKKFYTSSTNLATSVDLFDSIDKDKEEKDKEFYILPNIGNDENDIIKVIKNVTVGDNLGTAGGVTTVYGNQETTPFMTSHNFTGLKFTIYDFEGIPVKAGVKAENVIASFKLLENTAYSHGFYTYIGSENVQESMYLVGQIKATQSGVGEFTIDSFELIRAGEYQFSIEVIFDDETKQSHTLRALDENNVDTKLVHVYSAKPTATIASVSTNKTSDRYYQTATPSSTSNMISGSYNKKLDDYSAVVYMSVGDSDYNCVNITYPTVTLALSGVVNTHGGASMVIPGGNDTTTTFTFASGSMSSEAKIGAGQDGEYDWGYVIVGAGVTQWPVFYPAGKQTVNQIVIKDAAGIDYTVDLSHEVTINNPLYPIHADFKINDSTFTGTTPSSVYTQDGETITLTLPTIAPWSYTQIDDVPGTETLTSDKTDDVYTAKWGTIRYTYTYYKRNTKVYTSVGTSTSYLVTKEIIGWKIDGKEYKPGDQVTLTSNKTITAVVKTTTGTKTTITTTVTRTVVSFTATGETSQGWSPKRGSEVTSTKNYETTTSSSN